MSQEPVRRKPGRPRKNPIPEQQVDVAVRDVGAPEVLEPEAFTTPAALKVHIYPKFKDGEIGGIARVVEGQKRHLAKYGIEIVDTAEEADVIASHAVTAKTYLNLYPDKAFVAICHGLYWSEYEWSDGILRINADVLECIRTADAVATCSEWVANSIRRNTSRPVSVIYHGIDADDWYPEDTHDYVLWNKSRPDPVCDPKPVNDVAALLPDVKFISSFGEATKNVVLTGQVDFEKAKVLVRKAGVYLCTTRETFGIGTLEAMACGVPVVGYAWGGQTEIIESGVDGWLVTPGDIWGLAEGIKWALANRAEISPKAIAKAKKFNWEEPCRQYAELFFQAYARKHRPGPRTSIIVTNYNLEKYLTDTLESVARQTDHDWECIVVDDASTNPEGRAISAAFASRDERFKVVNNEQNAYLAEARNIGISHSTGRYILPLDGDDMLTPDTVELLADALDKERRIHVAYGGVLFVEEDGTTPREFGYGLPSGHSTWPWDFEFEQQIQQRNLLPYASMYRREAWEWTGGYRRRCRTAEDADFWTRISSYGFEPAHVTTKDTLIHRYRPRSMSQEQGDVNWTAWFPWSKIPSITPAGAMTKKQLPVPSLDPIVISVIIPVGPGHEKIFTDAVDSVDCQTFRNWECLVVNDTGKPFETELPAWVRVIDAHGPNGVAYARNVGIQASRGSLFLPLDADDYLMPTALENMYAAHAEKVAPVIYSDFWQTSLDGKDISLHKCDDYDAQFIQGKRRTWNGEVREGMIHAATILCPKAVWRDVGGYDENLPAWEDWDFQIAIANKGICSRRVAAPLFFYRKHTGFRRNQNFSSFEESKNAIVSKWSRFWEGGEQLMACRSCGAKPTYIPGNSSWNGAGMQQSLQSMSNGEAVMIENISDHVGAIQYRAPSKTVYSFGAGDVKYVLAQDAEFFLRQSEVFRVAQEIDETTPALVADGPPS